ncbi:MAG: hypothetical protein ACPLZF_06790 [Nitrososphaeria archaeon]
MVHLRRFVGMISAIILSTPLNIMTLIFSSNTLLGITTVIFSYATLSLCGIFYDIILSKIRDSISSYGRFLAYTGIFWISVFPIQQYFIEIFICYAFEQPLTSFTLQYLIFGMIFGLGFGLLFSVVYVRLFAYVMLKDSEKGEKLEPKKKV